MGEVITVGASDIANHVLTHLYNKQESHIPYRKNQQVLYDNRVFLSSSLVNGSTNYHPRALIFDVRNGFGALSKYEFYESTPDLSNFDIINTQEPIVKNEYQIGLDKGENKLDSLSTTNTKYWSDYNKLIYKPSSLHMLDNWEIRDGTITNRNTPTLHFDKFNYGQEEFRNQEDDILDSFRKLLEECDYFQGMQLVTESESGWSGFTNEFLLSVKDQYFNYTSNNKFNIWSYNLFSPQKLNQFQMLTRIKSMVELSKTSSLVIPLSVDRSSSWHNSAKASLLINSIWELLNTNKTNMKDFETTLLQDEFNRNIVNMCSFDELKEPSVSLKSLSIDDSEKIDLGYNKNSQHNFGSNSIVAKRDQSLVKNDHSEIYPTDNSLLNISKIDTFPEPLSMEKAVSHFRVDSSFKSDFRLFINYVTRSKFSDDILEDKDELLQDLHQLSKDYTYGPEFEDEESDYDDY